MGNKDEEFLKHLQATFRLEAEDHVRAFTSELIALEKTRSPKRSAELIENIFRGLHNLKGAARSVGQKDIEALCHPLESLFSEVKHNELLLTPESIDLLFRAIGKISDILKSDISKNPEERQNLNELINEIKRTSVINQQDISSDQSDTGTKPGNTADRSLSDQELTPITNLVTSEVVRIPVSRLDPLLLQAEELIQIKSILEEQIKELKEITGDIGLYRKNLSDIRNHVTTDKSNKWLNWLESNETLINKIVYRSTHLSHSMGHSQYTLNRLLNNHLDEMRQVLMLPVSSMVESFPFMVRNISARLNKKIEFIINGTEIEIDKRILDEIKDPLIHLIRNCIDHGIEDLNERISVKKTAAGVITLSFSAVENGIVEIILTDDGKGIDNDEVLKAAVRSGHITPEESKTLDPAHILSLIFRSDISTSPAVTDISGRGLGLSIVYDKVEKLNGTISVDSKPGYGTSFRILLPMSLTTFRSIQVKARDKMFMIPLVNVDRVLKIKKENIKTVENIDTLKIGDQILPVADLGTVLGLRDRVNIDGNNFPSTVNQSNQITIAILSTGSKKCAFIVDDIIGEKQVLVKGLGKLLKRLRNISGAIVLGTGEVVPVLNVSDLIKSSLLIPVTIKDESDFLGKTVKKKKILVAEDSITARTLLKNILEAAGYHVTTAVDGINAFTLVRNDKFDIILSDIDMPRMNGFELTARIKNDKKLENLPVVLVSALESRADKERGAEVGADAYIVKSSFDQTNLLDIIRRLI